MLVWIDCGALLSKNHPKLACQPCPWSVWLLPRLVGRWRTCHHCPFDLSENNVPSVWANIYGVLSMQASQVSVNLCETGAFHGKKLVTALHLVHASTTCVFCAAATLNACHCLAHYHPGASGQCCRPVGKAGNYPVLYLKKKKEASFSYQPL